MQRLLIVLGVALLLAGIAWPFLSRIGLGRLPGDIAIQRGNKHLFPNRHLHPHQYRFQRPDVAVQSLIVNRSPQWR
jgi:hypothetical protein